MAIPRGVSFHARAQTTKGNIANDFTDMVDVNSRSTQKIDVSVGSNARSQLDVRVTAGNISITAVSPDPKAPQQTANTTGSE